MFERGKAWQRSTALLANFVSSKSILRTHFRSRLFLGWWGPRPIHVLAAAAPVIEDIIVMTAYQPSETQWETGFAKKKV